MHRRLEDAELLLQRTNAEDALRIAESLAKDLNVLEALVGIDVVVQDFATRVSAQSLGAEPSRRAVAYVLTAIRRQHRRMVKHLKKRQRSDLDTKVDRYWRRLLSRASIAVGTSGVLLAAIHGVSLVLAPKISIVEASYGVNCNDTSFGRGAPRQVSVGDATAGAKYVCEEARKNCTIVVTAKLFGDPAPFCAKDFRISWLCSNRPGTSKTRIIPAEAFGHTVQLECP